MLLNAESIKNKRMINPFSQRYTKNGLSGGASEVSYDIAVAHTVTARAGVTTLAVTKEFFGMPTNIAGRILDKSTHIRNGLRVGNTFIDPGFKGYITLELTYSPYFDGTFFGALRCLWRFITGYRIEKGTPVAQVVFEATESTTGYSGKYQGQPATVVAARLS